MYTSVYCVELTNLSVAGNPYIFSEYKILQHPKIIDKEKWKKWLLKNYKIFTLRKSKFYSFLLMNLYVT